MKQRTIRDPFNTVTNRTYVFTTNIKPTKAQRPNKHREMENQTQKNNRGAKDEKQISQDKQKNRKNAHNKERNGEAAQKARRTSMDK